MLKGQGYPVKDYEIDFILDANPVSNPDVECEASLSLVCDNLPQDFNTKTVSLHLENGVDYILHDFVMTCIERAFENPNIITVEGVCTDYDKISA